MSALGDLLKTTDVQSPFEEFENVGLALLALNIY